MTRAQGRGASSALAALTLALRNLDHLSDELVSQNTFEPGDVTLDDLEVRGADPCAEDPDGGLSGQRRRGRERVREGEGGARGGGAPRILRAGEDERLHILLFLLAGALQVRRVFSQLHSWAKAG